MIFDCCKFHQESTTCSHAREESLVITGEENDRKLLDFPGIENKLPNKQTKKQKNKKSNYR